MRDFLFTHESVREGCPLSVIFAHVQKNFNKMKRKIKSLPKRFHILLFLVYNEQLTAKAPQVLPNIH